MTAPAHIPRLPERKTASGRVMALVSLTITARAIVFSNARCPGCGRWLMAVPGECGFSVRLLNGKNDRSGDGRIVHCKYCGEVEIVEIR